MKKILMILMALCAVGFTLYVRAQERKAADEARLWAEANEAAAAAQARRAADQS